MVASFILLFLVPLCIYEYPWYSLIEFCRRTSVPPYARPLGVSATPSPPAKTPSPPVALRTRSKSPVSLKKATMEAARVGGDAPPASPRSVPKKRASVIMSPDPKVKKNTHIWCSKLSFISFQILRELLLLFFY